MSHEHKRLWKGETHTERADAMRKSLTQDSVSASDTCIVLEDWAITDLAYMTVAHISSHGWIDVFKSMCDEHDDDVSRHVSLTPSQAETLMAAYAAHQKG